jgi:hypothetical protein
MSPEKVIDNQKAGNPFMPILVLMSIAAIAVNGYWIWLMWRY